MRVMKLYRGIARETWAKSSDEQGSCLADQEVIVKHSFISPLNLVTLARIQLFGRAVIKAPECLLQLLAAADCISQKSWLTAVRSDIAILVHMPHFSASKLAALLKGDHGAIHTWANAFRSLQGKARMALVELMRDKKTNAARLSPQVRWQVASMVVQPCRCCAKVFNTRQRAAVHDFFSTWTQANS